MITAYKFELIPRNIAEAIGIVQIEMPAATFVLTGVDNDYIYFNVVARQADITEEQKRDITEKTRFQPMPTVAGYKGVYKRSFKMFIY